jgi:hypothetical protein
VAVDTVCQARHLLKSRAVVGMVVTTACDQMRRAAEAVDDGRVFLFDLPHTWQTPAAVRRYQDELRRLGRRMVAWGGSSPTPAVLAAAMRDFDDARCELRARRSSLTGAEWHRLLGGWLTGGMPVLSPAPAAAGVRIEPGRPVLLIGGPLPARDDWLLDALTVAGLRLAADGTDGGERILPRPYDRRRLAVDPFDELAEAHFGHLPDIFRRPDSRLFDWIADRLRQEGIRAVILVPQVSCDRWYALAGRLREWLTIPGVVIDLGGGRARVATRLRALAETLG